MSTDPTEYPAPLEPTQNAYSNPYEPTSPYDVPPIPIPPPPPKRRRKGLLVALISTVCLALILGGVLIAVFAQHGQKPATGAMLTPTATIAPTHVPTATSTMPEPTPTTNTTVMSSVPLIEKGANGWFYCYAVPDDTNPDGVYAVLSNPDQQRVYEDCKSFMSYGPYFSVAPSYVQTAGELRLSSAWAADNTYWRVMSQVRDLESDRMVGALDQLLPGAQG
jgi:hypothetical protein